MEGQWNWKHISYFLALFPIPVRKPCASICEIVSYAIQSPSRFSVATPVSIKEGKYACRLGRAQEMHA